MRRKPAQSVRASINWANPLSRGLIGAWYFTEHAGNATANAATGLLGAWIGFGPAWRGASLRCPAGMSFKTDTGLFTTANDFTICADYACVSGSAGTVLGDYDYNFGFRLYAGATDTEIGGVVVGSVGPPLYVDVGTLGRHQVAMRRNGTARTIIADSGRYSASDTVDGTALFSTLAVALVGTTGATNSWTGDIYSVQLFDRALSDTEIYSLQHNPYQLLRSRSAYDIGAWLQTTQRRFLLH
jgi:hypothetical protein